MYDLPHAKVDPSSSAVVLGDAPLTIDDVVCVAHGRSRLATSTQPEFIARIEAGASALAARLADGRAVYGVTTGFGESCVHAVDAAQAHELPLNLLRFHGCGTGRPFDDIESAAIVTVRAASLVAGWSAVRPRIIERLCSLVQHRALPVIPSEGSVGASGDLTPLSYVAAALVGERELSFEGRVVPAAQVLKSLALEPLELGPKESLAIMNGTSVMAALGCLAHARARVLARWVAALTAMASDVLQGNPAHFDDRIFAAKPHPGQRKFAQWVREDIEYERRAAHEGRIQDRYSIRCAPHVGGVLLDALTWMRPWLEIEVNGANDNPLVDPDTGDILHGGNFYGGHACFVSDGLKNAVANMADLVDRQMALLCSRESNAGLPENLVGELGPARNAHHGFKAMQIAASALTAEALKLASPMSVFSRSTECHNQDKVSMGTIAARESLRILELSETVAAIATLALCQAVDLRRQQGQGECCHRRSRAMHEVVRAQVGPLHADRRQDRDIATVLAMHARGELALPGLESFGD